MSPAFALSAFVTSFLVGFTGVGAGTILTPVLILLGVPASHAIGSDFCYNSVTKTVGAVRYAFSGNVDYGWVVYLALGSIPGVIVGAIGLDALRSSQGPASELIIQRVVGVVLALVAATGLARQLVGGGQARAPAPAP